MGQWESLSTPQRVIHRSFKSANRIKWNARGKVVASIILMEFDKEWMKAEEMQLRTLHIEN